MYRPRAKKLLPQHEIDHRVARRKIDGKFVASGKKGKKDAQC